MQLINKIMNRIITKLLLLIQPFLKYPRQLTFAGANSAEKLCQHIARLGYSSVLLVTDKILLDIGLAKVLIETLESKNVTVVIYDGVQPDPTSQMVDGGAALATKNKCDAVLALGGGSSIDTAKGIAAVLTNGDIRKLIGILKVKKQPKALFAIPTTSGTGSEVSIAAVISDSISHEKGVIGDPKLIPAAIALDPTLLTGMPQGVTAATGFDALSHAIETYVGRWSNPTVKQYSASAVELIFEFLPRAYENGKDIDARESMSLASYYAGVSLNDGSVGNVHALAHQLGARYGIPHGVAISAVMPHVLIASFDQIKVALAQLADHINSAAPGSTVDEKANSFINAVQSLQTQLKLPTTMDNLNSKDIPGLARDGIKESLVYPVPYFLSQVEAEDIFAKLLKNTREI